MIPTRRASALALVAALLVAGCGSSDVVIGSGGPAGGSSGSSGSSGPSGSFGASGGSGSSASVGSGSAGTPSPSSSGADPEVSLSSVSGTVTTVALDPGFLSALTALRVTPGLTGTAKLSGSSILLPVTGGRVAVYPSGAPQPVTASIDHQGSGLTLTAGANTIAITELRLDLGDAPQLNGTVTANGKVVVRSVTVFDIDDSAVRAVAATGNTVSISGVRLRTDSGLSDLLNKTFGASAFTAGLVFGTASSSLSGR